MNKKFQVLGFILGILLVFGVTSGVAVTIDQGNSNNIQLETDNFVVKVTGGGNVPKYSFWDPADNTTMYNVQFSQVFEAEDNAENGTENVYDLEDDKKVPKSNLALASLSWDFSEIEEADNGDVHFNITSSDGMIMFANHLYAADDNEIKFDVYVNGYEFVSNESMLVFAFKLTESTGEDEDATSAEQDDNALSFGDAYFESEETATAGGEIINVGLSTGTEENDTKIYIAYENFNGSDMIHDPTMGVQAAVVSPSDTTTTSTSSGTGLTNNEDVTKDEPNLASDETLDLWVRDEISREDAGLSSIMATIIALFVPIALYRSRK